MAPTFDTPITTNDQSLERVLNAGLPVALVFLEGGATTALGQALERVAREGAGKLLVVKIAAKENPAGVQRFQVRQAPAVVTVRNGQVQSQQEGITAADFEKHALFLQGKGPKPEPALSSRPAHQAAQSAPYAASGYDRPRAVSDANFDREVMSARRPVLVDFWAPWCGPCRMTEPVLEKLAREHAGELDVVKVNVDENPGLSMRYSVQSIPTMMIVQGGQIVDRWVGALPEGAIRSRISPLLR